MSSVPQGLTIDTELAGASLLVRVRGELDMSTAPKLSGALTEAAAGSADTIVLDLAGVTFIDSSALRVLVLSGRELASTDRMLQIGPRSEMVARVLTMTSLDTSSDAFEVLPQPG
jgi:anti-sigma B factor antagonist